MKTKLPKPKYRIKDILNKYFPDYLSSSSRNFYVTDYHLKVINTVRSCQTARLGIYNFACTSCGESHSLPRSCKNRFCNTCGSADTLEWVNKISRKIPDINYSHIVFTLPVYLRPLAKRNKEKFYNLLFRSSQETIKESFYKKYQLIPGIISVLHTNGSDLKYHPHIHNVVSCGGFNKREEFKDFEEDYLFAQRVLANSFREIFMKGLREELKNESLILPFHLTKGYALSKYLEKIESSQWITNVDKPIKGVDKIIAYVGRYTKKSCMSERRIESIDNGLIRFSYKDYKNSKRGEKPKENTMTLTSTDFLDRLMEHIPEKGFKVVRYYGMFSGPWINKIPKEKLLKDLQLADYEYEEIEGEGIEDCPFKRYRKQVYERTGKDPLYCYCCHQSMKLITIEYDKDGEIKTQMVEYDNSE